MEPPVSDPRAMIASPAATAAADPPLDPPARRRGVGAQYTQAMDGGQYENRPGLLKGVAIQTNSQHTESRGEGYVGAITLKP